MASKSGHITPIEHKRTHELTKNEFLIVANAEVYLALWIYPSLPSSQIEAAGRVRPNQALQKKGVYKEHGMHFANGKYYGR